VKSIRIKCLTIWRINLLNGIILHDANCERCYANLVLSFKNCVRIVMKSLYHAMISKNLFVTNVITTRKMLNTGTSIKE